MAAPKYILGTATHLFTGLPNFRSGFDAVEYYKRQPRIDTEIVYVYEERDAVKHGVVYGTHRKIVATVGV